MSAPPITTLTALATAAEPLFPPRQVPLPRICVHTNATPELQSAWAPAYAARIAKPHAVSLIRLPKGAEVSGPAGFAARADGHLIREQLPPRTDHLPFPADATVDAPPADTLLIARYGEGTWGHWLIELLPKAAVCEHLFPGRFRYLIPGWVLHEPVFGRRIEESLAAYNIPPDRLLPLPSHQVARFDALYALTPVHTDNIPHPDVAAILRGPPPTTPPTQKIALLRHDPRRAIANAEPVAELLRKRRFTPIDIATLDFAAQRALYATSHTIFSVLGSSLAGLIFSPDGTRVAAAAPDQFGDRFFHGMLQMRPGALWAEARGPVPTPDPTYYRDSAFHLPLPALRSALNALGI